MKSQVTHDNNVCRYRIPSERNNVKTVTTIPGLRNSKNEI
jgi:hypothetical protein